MDKLTLEKIDQVDILIGPGVTVGFEVNVQVVTRPKNPDEPSGVWYYPIGHILLVENGSRAFTPEGQPQLRMVKEWLRL